MKIFTFLLVLMVSTNVEVLAGLQVAGPSGGGHADGLHTITIIEEPLPQPEPAPVPVPEPVAGPVPLTPQYAQSYAHTYAQAYAPGYGAVYAPGYGPLQYLHPGLAASPSLHYLHGHAQLYHAHLHHLPQQSLQTIEVGPGPAVAEARGVQLVESGPGSEQVLQYLQQGPAPELRTVQLVQEPPAQEVKTIRVIHQAPRAPPPEVKTVQIVHEEPPPPPTEIKTIHVVHSPPPPPPPAEIKTLHVLHQAPPPELKTIQLLHAPAPVQEIKTLQLLHHSAHPQTLQLVHPEQEVKIFADGLKLYKLTH